MKRIFIVALASCNLEYKPKNNDVQDYHWIGLAGTEEIHNDTIYTYADKLGGRDFTVRLIEDVQDSVVFYKRFDEETGTWQQASAIFSTTMKNDIPYLTLRFENSVSLFTRKRVCPINFEKNF